MKKNINFLINRNETYDIWALRGFSIFVSLLLIIKLCVVLNFASSVKPALFVISFGVVLSILSVYLMFKQKYTIAKFILIIVPCYTLFVVSILIKTEGINNNIFTYLMPKFFSILYLMVPITFFGLRKKKLMVISYIILLPIVIFYDYINGYFGINVEDLSLNFAFYDIFIDTSFAFYFIVLVSLLLLENLNDAYKTKIITQKNEIEDENVLIKKLNIDLEYKYNLYQILDITSKHKLLMFTLQEVLEKILEINSLSFEQKGLISLTNSDGDLEIAANKNIDYLLGTCSLIKKGECLCGKALEIKKTIFCNSELNDCTDKRLNQDANCNYLVPILYKNEVLGMINVYTKRGHKIDLKIQEFLETVAIVLSKKIMADKVEGALRIKNIELDSSKKQIEETNLKLEETNLELKDTYKELDDSINYAEYMQQSLIPSKLTLDKFFKESDVLFSPKARVSGDFYFAQAEGNYLYFGVGDCTGHGIPGSFLAAMSIEAVKHVIIINKGKTPDVILEKLREIAKNRFSINKGDHRSDAMDAALCMYDKKEDVMYFSGGFLDMIIVRNNSELIDVKGTRCPVGSHPFEPQFELHQVKLQHNDVIYLSTDGFRDQFGAVNKINKTAKFKKKRFREMLLNISNLDAKVQIEKMDHILKEWRGDLEQIDDVTVFVVKHLGE